MIGKSIGPYQVLDKLGEGGMGEVYRARDSKLGRDVALKILPAAFATDVERLARFEREARTLAALNHPNIAQIYGLEQSGSASALVMELVQGDDLAQRIARGAIPIDEAVRIARQIAEALEAAHHAGIIHRDLKPANIKLGPQRTVKVLDFGLAKALDPSAMAPDSVNNSPTITSPAALTMGGMILGTAAYMSPEQARGHPVDARADIWAFGCVLYEMLTGRRLFEGPSVTDTLAEVLKKEVDPGALPADTPPGVRRALRRCLQRDPDRRFHSITDVRLELEDAAEGESPAPSTRGRSVPRWLWGLALGVVGLAVGAGSVWMARAPAAADTRLRAFTMAGAGFNFVGATAISRDGRWVAYSPDVEAAPFRMFLRSIESFEFRQIGTSDDTGFNPFFSSDGQWVAFFANNGLYKVSIAGGDPELIAPMPGPESRQGAWAADGTIIVSSGVTPGTSDGLWTIAPGGGAPSQLTQPGSDEAHLAPEILPDGRTVLFTILTRQSSSIAAIPLTGGTPTSVLSGARSARYAATGHLLFQRTSTDDLMAVAFDPSRHVVSGDAVRLTAVARVNELATYAVADDGTLLYSASGETAEQVQYSIVAVDRNGNERMLLDAPGNYAQPRVSPDGRMILYRSVASPYCDMWVLDLARGARTRVTVEGDNHDPVWHPNSRDITWSTDLRSGFEIRTGPVDRSRAVRALSKGSAQQVPASWTPDGRWLAFVDTAPPAGLAERQSNEVTSDIDLLDVDSGTTRPLLTTRFLERQPAFSPDGQWIAWVSNETGRDEVYIQRASGGEGRLQISTGGGHSPVWSRDGRELFYAETARLMSVALKLGTSAEAARPQRVIEGPFAWERSGNYDVMPDGRSFVFVKRVGRLGEAAMLRVILNWRQLAGGAR